MSDTIITIRAERIIEDVYPAVDAAFAVFLAIYDLAPQLRRETVTSGSILNHILAKNGNKLLTVLIRQLTAEHTHLVMTAPVPNTPAFQDYCDRWLDAFIGWRLDDKAQEPSPLPVGRAVPPALPVSRRGGAPTDDANDWARAQIASGADREATYLEWLKRRGQDAAHPEVRQRWRDAFRKAIGRGRRTDGRN